MKRILYATNGDVVIKTPTQERLASMTIIEIARQDTPTGLSFWFIDDEDIPADEPYKRASWNLGEPEGEGG